MVDTNDEWITTRTGIRTRHIAGPDDSVTSMATEAARNALADAGVAPTDVDLVVVALDHAPRPAPYTAGRVAAALGMTNGPAPVDINTACSGFEYAMAIADQAIRTGSADTAVVIGSETLSRIADWTDRSTCVLPCRRRSGSRRPPATDEPQIGPVSWGSVPHLQGRRPRHARPGDLPAGGSVDLPVAITEAEGHARAVVERAGLTLDDIGVFAFHQANLRINRTPRHGLGGEGKYVVRDVVESGNTSAASVPLGLSKAWHRGNCPRASRHCSSASAAASPRGPGRHHAVRRH